MSKKNCLCWGELVPGSRLSLPQVGVLMLHFGWGQERISEVLLPAGLGQLRTKHPTAGCAHSLTWPLVLTTLFSSVAALIFPPCELNQVWSRKTFPLNRTWMLHHSNRKGMPPLSTWVTPAVGMGWTACQGNMTFEHDISWVWLAPMSCDCIKKFSFCLNIREGGRTRLTLGVGIS